MITLTKKALEPAKGPVKTTIQTFKITPELDIPLRLMQAVSSQGKGLRKKNPDFVEIGAELKFQVAEDVFVSEISNPDIKRCILKQGIVVSGSLTHKAKRGSSGGGRIWINFKEIPIINKMVIQPQTFWKRAEGKDYQNYMALLGVGGIFTFLAVGGAGLISGGIAIAALLALFGGALPVGGYLLGKRNKPLTLEESGNIVIHPSQEMQFSVESSK